MQSLDLSDFISTKSQAVDFSARLAFISDSIFRSDFDLEEALQDQFGLVKKKKFISLLRNNRVPMGSNSELSKFIVRIQNEISSMSTATLKLAIEPDNELLKSISNWFLLNIKHQVLIDVQMDPSIIAGAIISYKGKQHNGSVQNIFEEIYITQPTSTEKNIKNNNEIKKQKIN